MLKFLENEPFVVPRVQDRYRVAKYISEMSDLEAKSLVDKLSTLKPSEIWDLSYHLYGILESPRLITLPIMALKKDHGLDINQTWTMIGRLLECGISRTLKKEVVSSLIVRLLDGNQNQKKYNFLPSFGTLSGDAKNLISGDPLIDDAIYRQLVLIDGKFDNDIGHYFTSDALYGMHFPKSTKEVVRQLNNAGLDGPLNRLIRDQVVHGTLSRNFVGIKEVLGEDRLIKEIRRNVDSDESCFEILKLQRLLGEKRILDDAFLADYAYQLENGFTPQFLKRLLKGSHDLTEFDRLETFVHEKAESIVPAVQGLPANTLSKTNNYNSDEKWINGIIAAIRNAVNLKRADHYEVLNKAVSLLKEESSDMWLKKEIRTYLKGVSIIMKTNPSECIKEHLSRMSQENFIYLLNVEDSTIYDSANLAKHYPQGRRYFIECDLGI